MQNTILFSFRRGLSSEEQDEFLDKVRRWDKVDSVGRFDPDSADAEDARVCFLYTTPGANSERVAACLKKDDHVDSASVQPYRYAAAI
jgi:hypothetical protein